jgi:D-alanyl-D-alanine carboxypeptidase/D-alanyl-D-alanine-endopeptidase (penicillin-binding protein 4)
LRHTYANTGLPAIEVGNDPLTGVNDLAQQVAASGITKVRGDVIVDDRLFDTFFGWPDVSVSPASPIMINDNRIDILSTPAKPGQAAQMDYRPKTAAFRVTSNVKTVKAGGATALTVTQPKPNIFQVSGTIAADAGPTLRIGQIPNPASFARTAFIEALQRAGVTVTAPPTGAARRGSGSEFRAGTRCHRGRFAFHAAIWQQRNPGRPRCWNDLLQ